MGREPADARLIAIFLDELDERVRALNDDALGLDRAAPGAERDARLTGLLRAAHSLKGAARAVDVRPVERLGHELEAVLLAVRAGRLDPGRELCSLLLDAADAIADAGARLRAGEDPAAETIGALLPRLEAAATGASAAAPVSPRSVPSGAGGEKSVVRVAAERLDTLLAHTGELLVARRRVESRPADVGALRELAARTRAEWRAIEKALRGLLDTIGGPLPHRIERALPRTAESLRRIETELERLRATTAADGRLLANVAGPLDDDVRRARMLPFAEACADLARTAHDLAEAGGKEVEVVVVGGDVELDRSVLEGLRDPLRHLVRNAVDHGIEPAAERCALSKPPRATITVSAALRSGQVDVVVADDGRGIDGERLREAARRHGVAAPPDDEAVARLVFEPGLSTAPTVSDVSGRGVGLDVVKSRIEALHGAVDVSSRAGGGTRFVCTVPLTLTTLHALLVTAGGQTLALPSASVLELLRVAPGDVRGVRGRDVLPRGGALVPVASLSEILGLPGTPSGERASKVPALVVATGRQRVAFVVDELVAAQDVVVKGLGERLRRVPLVSGATILPSGRVALVLNAAHLVRRALAHAPAGGLATTERAAPVARKRVLLCDDSITTRALERSLLEAAGYEVLVAVDGEAAWRLLQEHGADVIVSDVDMPRMDGCALTRAVRDSAGFRDLPVVLLTGLECEADKARGLQAGANAYLTKSAFDHRGFLDTIAQLL